MQSDFFKLTGIPPRMRALLDAMHAGDPDRWLPRRVVLHPGARFGFGSVSEEKHPQ